MPPRRAPKPRDVKSAAPSPSPAAPSRGASRSRSRKTASSEDTVSPEVDVREVPVVEVEEEEEAEGEGLVAVGGEDGGADQLLKGTGKLPKGAGVVEEDRVVLVEEEGANAGKLSLEERMAKLKNLRIRMNESTAANRRDLITDHQKSKVTAKELQRLEKQKKLAQTLRLKAEAEDTGEDLERKKAWEWSVEQNERWEAKQEEQRVRSDSHYHNAEDDAHKKYQRNIRTTKADLVSYNRQKEEALGLAPGTLVHAGTTNAQLAVAGPSRGLTAHEDLYRGADTLSYGDSKPSEEAVDRVISKINKDIGKGKKQKRDDDEEVTYINERNRVFNRKIARYFDKYTKEIRANFERGTAL